jgi:hypothetical protein
MATKKVEAIEEEVLTIENEVSTVENELPLLVEEELLEEEEEEEELQLDPELMAQIEWIEVKKSRSDKSTEEPFHIMVYYKITKTDKGTQKHGRITFSHFLTQKYGENMKYKFGALGNKVIFQVNKEEGFASKIASKAYPKNCVSNSNIAEIIYDKYGLKQGSNATYFKLKYLGNDFYKIDEIIK